MIAIARNILCRATQPRGDSLIEVMIAALCGIVIIGALAVGFISGNDSSLGSQRETQLVEAANREMEAIHQLVKTDGFSLLAMSSLPPAASSATVKFNSSTPLDPNSFAITCGSSEGYKIEANYDDTSAGLVSSLPVESPCTTAGLEPFITSSNSCSSASAPILCSLPSSTTVGSMSINFDYYVTQTYVGCNTTLGSGSCTNDARRVIVAAVDSNAASACSSAASSNRCAIGADSPVYLTTIFTNPVPTNAPQSSIGLTLGAQLG